MKNFIEKIKSLKASTKIRTILQILAYVNDDGMYTSALSTDKIV